MVRRSRHLVVLFVLGAVGAPLPAAEIDFELEVVPLLIRRCLECHDEANASGGLALSSHDRVLRGGDSGVVFHAGKPAESVLLQRVTAGEMPPPRQGLPQPLPKEEVAVLQRWIEQGAKWPEGRKLDPYEMTTDVRAGRNWWSLQPVKRPEVPKVARSEWQSNPIDAFILARLNKEGMTPAPEADRRTLIRRVYQDVIGLPPTREAIEAFVADASPQAWESLVERLLSSQHFGERWARYWLDIARFAETSGYERDQTKPFAWKYRDWVVKAINDDMPYDRFIIEQLAGDEVPERTVDSVIATGFLRFGTWNDEPNDPEDYQYDRLEDLVHTTSTAFLGLTVKCARCHDHKFDPIPQVDYYRMASAFWAGPIGARDRALLGGPSAEELGEPDVLGWTDLGKNPPPLHLLKKGDRHRPQQVIEPAALSLMPANFRTFSHPKEATKTTGRRLQLAQWIASRENPIVSRVAVNRMWQHHFGAGLSRSPDNFGFHVDPPSHPELLEWLADEFMKNGWRSKPLHWLILTSQTYRQSSLNPQQDAYNAKDSANRYLWRANRRRLDAEGLRDALLSVSGELDLRMGGPSFLPTITPEALEGLSRKAAAWKASPWDEQRRRSLYMFSQRSLLSPFMTVFDFGDTNLSCGQRDVTIVAPQALALLNDEFSHGRSAALAERVKKSAGEDRHAQIQAAWSYAFGRNPEAAEMAVARKHMDVQRDRFAAVPASGADPEMLALASLCHVLLNANEFLYVD